MGYLDVKTKNKWLLGIFTSSLIIILLMATFLNLSLLSYINTLNSILTLFSSNQTKINHNNNIHPTPIPRFAYLISGSKGDLHKLWRVLHSLYHPLNYYLLHLDLESPQEERSELARRVKMNPVFAEIGNVVVNEKANMVTYRGPTMVSNTLHGCAILLKRFEDWDWFINLSASDYPLVTQDDLLHTFSTLERHLNFIGHTSNLGWKASYRAKPLIIDPGLYDKTKSNIFRVAPMRTLPTSFKLFTGSAWMILSRAFVEYTIWGWDNLPRTLVMYYTNFVSSPEGYFQTVVCNSLEFRHTVVNHDMHYIPWDFPPKQHPRTISLHDMNNMTSSGAAFARKFKQDSPVLDKIDEELLGRSRNGSFTPGGWCGPNFRCFEVWNRTHLEPGDGARRLEKLLNRLILFGKRQPCV